MNKKRKDILNFVVLSTIIAVIILMTFVPFLGYIPLGFVSLSLMHIPVLIAVIILPPKHSIIVGLMFGLSSFLTALIRPNTLLDYVFRNPLVSILPRVLFAAFAVGINKLLLKLTKKHKIAKTVEFLLTSIITTAFIFIGLSQIISYDTLAWYLILLISILVSTLLLIIFYYIIGKRKTGSNIPTTFLVGTIFHTTIVMLMVYLFGAEELGGIASAMGGTIGKIITGTILLNGTLEGLLAVIVGLPISAAITSSFPELGGESHETLV